jgi:hypothetical protein
MMRLSIPVDTVGGDGAAVGSARVGIPGGIAKLIGLAVAYDPAAPASTNVVVTCTLPVTKTLLTLAASATDLPLSQPTELEVDTVSANRAEPATKPQLISGELVVDVDSSDELAEAVVVTAVIEI